MDNRRPSTIPEPCRGDIVHYWSSSIDPGWVLGCLLYATETWIGGYRLVQLTSHDGTILERLWGAGAAPPSIPSLTDELPICRSCGRETRSLSRRGYCHACVFLTITHVKNWVPPLPIVVDKSVINPLSPSVWREAFDKSWENLTTFLADIDPHTVDVCKQLRDMEIGMMTEGANDNGHGRN